MGASLIKLLNNGGAGSQSLMLHILGFNTATNKFACSLLLLFTFSIVPTLTNTKICRM